jgi:hypothetical protein
LEALIGLQMSTAERQAITKTSCIDDPVLSRFVQFTPDTATLLGALLSAGQTMDTCLSARCDDMARRIPRLEAISAHDARVLLKSSFCAPKLQHLPAQNISLQLSTFAWKIDNPLRAAVGKI